jgi:hypothetical protein
MKHCPVCKSSYTDDSLSFCLSDGAALIASAPSSGSEVTQRMSFSSQPTVENNPPFRVQIQSETPTHFSVPKNTTQIEQKRSNSASVLIIIALLVVIVVGGSMLGYFAFIRQDNSVAAVNSTPTPAPANTATPVQSNTPDETQILKEKLEKLERQLNDQKNARNNPSSPAFSPAPSAPPITVPARVNSPNDGFLALRTAPNAKTGVQILQIPHGATVNVLACQSATTIGDRRGRWCRVIYNGRQGWAFDAFLVY